MTARLTAIVIVAFWLTMNVFLWRVEYGSHGASMPVPPQLIWKKILTAPDASSLTIYANGERTGFCEISTGVGQEMAALDADKVPSGLSRTGYQIHTSGNLSLGDFSNRFKFDGRIRYNKSREWEELEIRISNRTSSAIIHSIATNQTVEITVNSEDGKIHHEFSFDDLRNPNILLRSFAGDLAGDFDLPLLPESVLQQNLQWQAYRDRVTLHNQPVSVYKLELQVLGRKVMLDVSTVGEIIRVQLPGNVTAVIDEWNKP